VQAITIDKFCSTHGVMHVDLMKMDIEGSETRALRGARKMFLERAIVTTLIEFNPFWLRRMGSSPDELYDLFEEYGLHVHYLTRFGNAVPISRKQCMAKITEPETYFNLVLTH